MGTSPFQTFHDAYAQYNWEDQNFNSTEIFLDGLRAILRDDEVDSTDFKAAAVRVTEWGRTKIPTLEAMDCSEAMRVLRARANLLNPKYANTNSLRGFKNMGAGYSKIYSLMLDGFPIYDSRVACALTSLIWLFYREKTLSSVPDELLLGVPIARTVKRNPYRMNGKPFRFPNIAYTQQSRYAISNVKAAWILGELADLGEFAALPANRRVSALQAALFMLGYKPLSSDALK